MDVTNLAELLDVNQTGPDEFTSVQTPQHMGPNPTVGYGGFATGYAVRSAFKTITKSNLHVYSLLGAFHGPTRTDRPIICRVTRTRDTRTFATRRIIVYQKQEDGSERVRADMFIDFHVLEDEMMRFSATPSMTYSSDPEDHSTTASGVEAAAKLIGKGQATQALADKYTKLFALYEDLFELRSCLEGVSGQTLHGMVRDIKTTQDHLSIPDKTSAEWIRCRQPLNNEAENTAALVFMMDASLTTLPLVMDHKNFDDTSACSTLDFALRIVLPEIQLHKWYLRERKAVAAAVGRTYSESRLWDQGGNLVAVMNQACILRPRTTEKARI